MDWQIALCDACALLIVGLLTSMEPLTASEVLHGEKLGSGLRLALERLLSMLSGVA